MTLLAFLFLLTASDEPFVVQAAARISYNVELSRTELRSFADDIGLFKRHMPGVVGVTPLGPDTYLYQTEKEVPLSSAMKTDFIIGKRTVGDSVTVYESVNPADQNYMFCRVLIRPVDENTTTIEIELKLRMERESGSDIHWLAPLLGATFISDQMEGDIEDMLQTFVEKSNEELYQNLKPSTANR